MFSKPEAQIFESKKDNQTGHLSLFAQALLHPLDKALGAERPIDHYFTKDWQLAKDLSKQSDQLGISKASSRLYRAESRHAGIDSIAKKDKPDAVIQQILDSYLNS